MNDEFFIGWEEKAPAGISRRVRRAVLFLAGFAIVLGGLLPVAQHTIGVSVFEWGKVKEFSGVLKSRPYPHLLVPRPGNRGGPAAFSSYYLVKPFKFGLDTEITHQFDGQAVRLKGTLIYRGNQTMIEVADGSLKADATSAPQRFNLAPSSASLGQQTLIGEIVDSKCYLGVMNPGALATHRACAIRCISGGIPPILLVRQANGPALHFLLMARDGKLVNKQVLALIAEPVEVTGEVERLGELLILRSDPATYRRVSE